MPLKGDKNAQAKPAPLAIYKSSFTSLSLLNRSLNKLPLIPPKQILGPSLPKVNPAKVEINEFKIIVTTPFYNQFLYFL